MKTKKQRPTEFPTIKDIKHDSGILVIKVILFKSGKAETLRLQTGEIYSLFHGTNQQGKPGELWEGSHQSQINQDASRPLETHGLETRGLTIIQFLLAASLLLKSLEAKHCPQCMLLSSGHQAPS